MTWSDTIFILPEIVLAIGASLLLVLPVIGKRERGGAKLWMVAVLAATAATVIVCSRLVETIEPTS